MSDVNPYLPPDAILAVEQDTSTIELATLGQRFWAGILDAIIGIACALPLLFAFGIFNTATGEEPPFLVSLGITLIAFILFIAIHGYFLKRNGQTIGKKVLGIKITNIDDSPADFGKIIALRYLPISAVTVLPLVGQILPLVDVLFVFRSDRRCIHDLIAGTKVIKAQKN